MRTKIKLDNLNVLMSDVNSINNCLINETANSINTLNEMKNVWKDYNSEQIINQMINTVKTLNKVSIDLNTMSNFCIKTANVYNEMDNEFKNRLIRDEHQNE